MSPTGPAGIVTVLLVTLLGPSLLSAAQVVVPPDPTRFEANAPTDDPVLEAQVRKLARQLRCPTCQALSIADSPSELAREMEGVIRMRLQEGMTPEQVRASFVNSYGEWVLLSPDPTGFNLLVYVLPFAVLLLGAGIVTRGMRKWLAQPAVEGLEADEYAGVGVGGGESRASDGTAGGSDAERMRPAP
jgi:cytochrome c-type biogenesis protein CcmH/NrfF